MKPLNRRQFMLTAAAGLCSAATGHADWPFSGGGNSVDDIRGHIFKQDAPAALWKWSTTAVYFKRLDKDTVVCTLCPNRCRLSPGDRSVCRSRVNLGGTLYSLAYGNACSANLDPIEKKPLYHFLPATWVFSIAAAGCNFRCLNCQNWEISQSRPEDVRHMELFPEAVVAAAEQSASTAIAYTYSEPTTFYEYMIDTARLARAKGLKNVWVSNGYINREPLLALCKVLDGANVNLKSISDAIYRRLNGGRLQPVLDTFVTLHRQGIHFEMTHLVVPGYGDTIEMLQRMCAWILKNLGPDHPLHLLRFFPRYRLDRLSPTPVATLIRFREQALAEGLHYVYLGNVPGHAGNHTYCHQCKRLLVERQGYRIPTLNIKAGHCRFCGTPIPGVWPEDGA
ncbi:AmmeMemoRadiSam system radical SAM enzyme [Desulfosarcina ovata]|nr:AmmeMemoRadiSam system radical SAM enzyme [Desulfosarcina ovata]